jgi:SAM-dependent methyltransferase
MNNYEFCAHWVGSHHPPSGAMILDYGCGAGQIVKLLRADGHAAFGCDVFYDGGDYSNQIESDLFGTVIRRMGAGGEIPFDDASFHFVINNQVMEHVRDIDRTLSEIDRVLKPGGKVLSLFPDKSVWREGHCGIPFLHWFPKRSRSRVYYAAAWRSMGFGHHKNDKTVMRWSDDFCNWLDEWTCYRSNDEIDRAYASHFDPPQAIEAEWLLLRLSTRRWIAAWVPPAIRRAIVNKLAGRVFVSLKPPIANPRNPTPA